MSSDSPDSGNPQTGASARGPMHGPQPGENVLEFEIVSDLLEGRRVQDAILDACRKNGFGDDAYFAVKLALDEAVTNAIKHGNGMDRSKRVQVRAAVSEDRVWIEIRDEGPGFKREHVPDPRNEENLHKCSGRGLLLIEAYMTHVDWSPDGRAIQMAKANQSEPPAVPS